MPLNPKYHPSVAVRFLILSFLQRNSEEGRLIAVILKSDHSCSDSAWPRCKMAPWCTYCNLCQKCCSHLNGAGWSPFRFITRLPNRVTGAEASSYSTVLSSAISEGTESAELVPVVDKPGPAFRSQTEIPWCCMWGSSPDYWLINPTDNPGRIKPRDHCNQLTASLRDIMVWIQGSMHSSPVHAHVAAADIKIQA